MSRKLIAYAAVVLLAFGAWQQWQDRPLQPPPGVLAAAAPLQRSLDHPQRFKLGAYSLQAQARYTVTARILGRETYRRGREAEVSPVDLALGWGPMSDSSVLGKLQISQGGRFYHLRWHKPPPIPEAVIMGHSANTHIIPASPRVADRIASIRTGDTVALEGYLVNVTAPDGWDWRTSMTRDDTGAGACEVLWVEHARVLDRPASARDSGASQGP